MKVRKGVSGIHTFELTFRSRSYADQQNMVDALTERGSCQFRYLNPAHTRQTVKSRLTGDCFGIAAEVHLHHDFKSHVKWIVNPEAARKGCDCPLGLFHCTKKHIGKLSKLLSGCMKQLEIPKGNQACTVSRVDLTTDLYCSADADLPLFIKLLRKSLGNPRYRQICFSDARAERHSCEFALHAKKGAPQVCFKAYDKIYQLRQTSRCPEEAENDRVLRLEWTLRREALVKKCGLARTASPEETLLEAVRKQEKITGKLARLLCPCSGDHLAYDLAAAAIRESGFPAETIGQMLFLLRKTSDSRDLSAALKKTRNQFHLSEKAAKKLLERFDAAGVHPVTIPQNEKVKRLPSLLTLLAFRSDEC